VPGETRGDYRSYPLRFKLERKNKKGDFGEICLSFTYESNRRKVWLGFLSKA
jgi:hypothetical protein